MSIGCETPKNPKAARCEDLPRQKRQAMSRESWIKNVLKIYPDKTREQAEELYRRLNFNP